MIDIWTSKWNWLLLSASLVLCVLLIYLYIIVSKYDQQNADGKHRDAAIVLGAALWNNKPSPALRERLNTALQLYRTGRIDMFILSGGLGKWGVDRTEAEAMKIYLKQHGVSPTKMLLEGKSRNTKENLLYTAEILHGKSIKSLYLVTDDFHMTRALLYAKQARLIVSPAPTHSKALFSPYYKIRECVALIKLYLLNQTS